MEIWRDLRAFLEARIKHAEKRDIVFSESTL